MYTHEGSLLTHIYCIYDCIYCKVGKWKSTEHLTNQTHGNLAYISLPRISVGLDKLIYFDVLIGTVCVASSIINIFVRVC